MSGPSSWSDVVEEAEVLGGRCLTFTRRPRSLVELLDGAGRHDDGAYLVQDGRRLTYAELPGAVAAVAGELRRRGVGRGDRIVLLGANSISWVLSWWAGLQLGAIVVTGNAWWSPDEIAHAVEIVDPRVVLTDARREKLVPAGVPCLRLGELTGAPSGEGANGSPGVDVHEDDPALILFTSGTTGMAKGATLTHRALVAGVQRLLVRAGRLPDPARPDARSGTALLSVPLFHIGGLQQIITPVVGGGTVVFGNGRFDAAATVATIRSEAITTWSAVPTMVARVVDHVDRSGAAPLDSLRTLSLGGAHVTQVLRDRIAEVFPHLRQRVSVVYGLSECAGVATMATGEELERHPGTVGRPLADVEIRIEGDGEILLRSPSVMLGYWPLTSADGPVTADRWLRTGDIGHVDAHGYLHITDRSKDIIIRGGENVAASRVEDCILEHPAVADVAVLGVPDDDLGEQIAAVVVVRDDRDVDEAELIEHARARLSHFEMPTRWWLRADALPVSAAGKVLKGELRPRFEGASA